MKEELTGKDEAQGLNENLSELAERKDIPVDEFEEMLEEKSMLELIDSLT